MKINREEENPSAQVNEMFSKSYQAKSRVDSMTRHYITAYEIRKENSTQSQ